MAINVHSAVLVMTMMVLNGVFALCIILQCAAVCCSVVLQCVTLHSAVLLMRMASIVVLVGFDA